MKNVSLGRDPFREKPRMASPGVIAGRLNNIATALNFSHQQLAEIRQDLGVKERLEVQRRDVEID